VAIINQNELKRCNRRNNYESNKPSAFIMRNKANN